MLKRSTINAVEVIPDRISQLQEEIIRLSPRVRISDNAGRIFAACFARDILIDREEATKLGAIEPAVEFSIDSAVRIEDRMLELERAGGKFSKVLEGISVSEVLNA